MENLKNLFVSRGSSHQAKIPTKSGKFCLSVMAGNLLYSTPREYREDCSYSEVEIAIFRTSDNGWATKEEASPVFPIIGEGEYAYWEEGRTAVFGYVDVNLIQQCIDVL